jgi:hypothetical protein
MSLQNLVAPHFITYALCAAEEALTDANWHPQEPSGLEHTVLASLTGGMSFEFCIIFSTCSELWLWRALNFLFTHAMFLSLPTVLILCQYCIVTHKHG